ncbi:hypothetical protein BaRGS_00023108, partial [Batillaria attramentaria]
MSLRITRIGDVIKIPDNTTHVHVPRPSCRTPSYNLPPTPTTLMASFFRPEVVQFFCGGFVP